MTYVVALLATRWGSELGGINVFNTGLAKAMPSVLTRRSRTLCFVEKTDKVIPPKGVDIKTLDWDQNKLAEEIAKVCGELGLESVQGILVIGHDVKTGELASGCVHALRQQLSPSFSENVLSAVVCHMDYSEYSFRKDKPFENVATDHQHQKAVVSAADQAFGVGPLLTANFSSARGIKRSAVSPVRKLIPGAAQIVPEPFDHRSSLQFFISGRLNVSDDPIKNSILSVHALIRAYELARTNNEASWSIRGKLLACGVDIVQDATKIDELRGLANSDAVFELVAIPFSDDQEAIHKYLAACHIAMMPSWHEGFGLSGWEALCAGVPLLCSQQSGLARFLEELKAVRSDLPLESVEFINLKGSSTLGLPSQHDVELMADAIRRMVSNLEVRKTAALKLARILKAEFTWKRCASDLLDSIPGWYLPGSVHWSARQKVATDAAGSSLLLEKPNEVLEKWPRKSEQRYKWKLRA